MRSALLGNQFFCLITTISLALAGATGISPAQEKSLPNPVDSHPTLIFRQFTADRPLHLVAYGDTRFTDPAVTRGTNPVVRKWLAERIAEQHPQAILLTGDTPFHGADPADWQVFQRETEPWRKLGAIQLSTLGNHEIYGGGEAGIPNYLKNFPDISGHRYYSALLGSVEVISLDYTQSGGASSPQAQWFAGQLDHIPQQVEFLLILYHLPWVADRQSQIFADLPNKDSRSLKGILVERLPTIRAKVVVFNGHIHNYERFEQLGVEYVITGGGGAEPYPILFRGGGDLYRDTAFPVYNYLVLDVAAHQLHAVMWKVKDPSASILTDEVMDQFTLTASPSSPEARTPVRSHKAHHPPD